MRLGGGGGGGGGGKVIALFNTPEDFVDEFRVRLVGIAADGRGSGGGLRNCSLAAGKVNGVGSEAVCVASNGVITE